MNKQYHVLNGDALREQFPKAIQGNILVARECLVDGDVDGVNLEELYVCRARFLSENYGGTEQDYFEKTVSEFQKILSIPKDSTINLWFEDDLFCQVNFWFIVHLLNSHNHSSNIYLIRPETHNQYGFGGLNAVELITCFKNRTQLNNLDKIASLWINFQKDEATKLLVTAKNLELYYPFILPAVEAHIDRNLNTDKPGRPICSLINIMNELETEDFGIVFREFNKRESIYGFGDLQVKRLYDQILNKT